MQQLCRMRRQAELRRLRGQGGFTLIELLVVIAVLGILSAVVVMSVSGVRDRGATSAAKQDARTLRTAEEAFWTKNQRYGDMAELEAAGLIRDASTLHDILLIGETPNGLGQSYRITCDPDTNDACGGDGTTPVGGTIRIAGGSSVTGNANWLNPAVTSGGGVHPNVEYMFNGLMRWSDNNTPQPDLAESYTISPDQKTYTFTLRSGLQWHNATPILATDVEFTFASALLKFHGRTSASVGPALGVTGSGASAVTPATAIQTQAELGTLGARDVRFNFLYSYAPLLRQMNVTESPIIPQNVYGACATAGNINTTACPGNNPGAGDDPSPTTVGSGPFKLKNRNTATGQVRFVKNTNYHLAGLPLADELLQIPSGNGADSLIADQVDVANVNANRVLPNVGTMNADITPGNGYTIAKPPRGPGGGNCILTQGFNLWRFGDLPAAINGGTAQVHPIFGDTTSVPANAGAGRPNAMPRGLVVRTALSMAVNRQALFDSNQFGKGQLATSPYHSKVPGYTATALPGNGLTNAQAVARANQWLTDAGWIDDGVNPVRVSDHNFGSGAGAVTANVTTLSFAIVYGQSTDSNNVPLSPSASPVGSQGSYAFGLQNQWLSSVKAQLGYGAYPNGRPNGDFGLVATNRDYDMVTVSYCNGDDPVIGVRRQYYAGLGSTASTQINGTSFTNTAGYRSGTMDALWDSAATGSNGAHVGIQAEAAANVPYIWLDESQGSRAWKTSKCAGFNNNNTGLFIETASCAA